MAATATTPSRGGWAGGRGYYADPKSPIASTPQQRRKAAAYPTTPSMATLSPMKHREVARARRVGDKGAVGDVPAGRTGGLFSPTARFDESEAASTEYAALSERDKENMRLGAGSAAAMTTASSSRATASGCSLAGVGGPSTATPMLAEPPRGRGDGPESSREAEASSSHGTRATGTATASSARRSHMPVASPTTSYATSSSSSSGYARRGRGGAVAPSEVHPGEMSTALTLEAAVKLASEVSAAHEAIRETDDWEAYEEYNPYLFIRLLPPYSSVKPRRQRIVLPPKSSRDTRMSLILDLDETLVHCSVEPIPDADLRFPVVFGGAEYEVYVRKRPFLERFLARVAAQFEVTVFTASQSVYASKLLDLIDPHGKWIHHRLYRDSCLCVDGNYIKDLNVLGRDLSQTVLVDNSQHAFGFQLDNGIPIESWFDDQDDRELLKLAWFLEKELKGAKDVRPVVRNKFRIRQLVEFS